MDVVCPRCGERCDMAILDEETLLRYGVRPVTTKQHREYAVVYLAVVGEFSAEGCAALYRYRGDRSPCVPAADGAQP